MIKKINFNIIVILILSWTINTNAQVDTEFSDFNRAGKTIYSFLRVEQGARPVAMGGAFTAISDDINGIFYNPAGLTNIENMEYTLSYTDWVVGSRFFSGAFGYTSSYGTVGISIVHFSINEFEETLPLQPGGTGRMVGAGNLAIGLAYARTITSQLSLGAHIRYVQETLDQDIRSTFAIDVATFYNTGFHDLILGVALKNLGPDQAVSSETRSESFPMPIDFNVTVAAQVLGSNEGPYSLTLAFDNSFTIDLGDRYRIGAELWIQNLVALRGGYRFNYSIEDYAFGVGVSPVLMGKKFKIDIAYTHIKEYFDAPLRISIGGEL